MGPTPTITLQTRVKLISDQASTSVADERVILHLEKGVYYGLDAVGSRIWSLLDEWRPLTEIRDRILEEYDVERERCETEILAFVRDLAEHGLIQVDDGTTD